MLTKKRPNRCKRLSREGANIRDHPRLTVARCVLELSRWCCASEIRVLQRSRVAIMDSMLRCRPVAGGPSCARLNADPPLLAAALERAARPCSRQTRNVVTGCTTFGTSTAVDYAATLFCKVMPTSITSVVSRAMKMFQGIHLIQHRSLSRTEGSRASAGSMHRSYCTKVVRSCTRSVATITFHTNNLVEKECARPLKPQASTMLP